MKERLPDDKVKVKLLICPECGNALRVSILHEMGYGAMFDFGCQAFINSLNIRTMSLIDYKASGIELYCKYDCTRSLTSEKPQ